MPIARDDHCPRRRPPNARDVDEPNATRPLIYVFSSAFSAESGGRPAPSTERCQLRGMFGNFRKCSRTEPPDSVLRPKSSTYGLKTIACTRAGHSAGKFTACCGRRTKAQVCSAFSETCKSTLLISLPLVNRQGIRTLPCRHGITAKKQLAICYARSSRSRSSHANRTPLPLRDSFVVQTVATKEALNDTPSPTGHDVLFVLLIFGEKLL